MSDTPGAIPWYNSAQTKGNIVTAISAIVALFPKVGTYLGLMNPTEITDIVSDVAGVAAVVTPVVATWLRSKSKLQPITLTKGNADEHNAKQAPPTTPPAGSGGQS